MCLTPGAYLAKRRTADGMSIRDVAARLRTEPPLAEHERIAWLERIERDEVPIGPDTIAALRGAYRFDRLVLARLGQRAEGQDVTVPPICRTCACSWNDPCLDAEGVPCAWVDGYRDLCTACRDADPAAAALTPANDAPAASGVAA